MIPDWFLIEHINDQNYFIILNRVFLSWSFISRRTLLISVCSAVVVSTSVYTSDRQSGPGWPGRALNTNTISGLENTELMS